MLALDDPPERLGAAAWLLSVPCGLVVLGTPRSKTTELCTIIGTIATAKSIC